MPLAVGPIALLAGLLIIIFRRQLRDFTVTNQKSMFGRSVGEQAEKVQSVFWIGFVGAMAIVIGLLMLGNGIYRVVAGG